MLQEFPIAEFAQCLGAQPTEHTMVYVEDMMTRDECPWTVAMAKTMLTDAARFAVADETANRQIFVDHVIHAQEEELQRMIDALTERRR